MTCAQKSDCGHVCGKPHHATLNWPGAEPSPVCYHHGIRAAGIAEHLGCWFNGLLVWTPAGSEYASAVLAVEMSGGDGKTLP